MINDYIDNWTFKINPPSFDEFLKSNEIKISPNFNLNENMKSIQNKNFKMTIKNEDIETSVTDSFMCWFYAIQSLNGNKIYQDCDKVIIRKLIRPYPYKSKKRRIIKKWWKNHSELIELHDVELNIDMENKNETENQRID